MSYAADVLSRGRHNANAPSLVDDSVQYRFESYTYGIGRYVRVCPELDAVITPGPMTGETYTVAVGTVYLPTKFRKQRTAVKAAVAIAKAGVQP
jgi:hypothetical protein